MGISLLLKARGLLELPIARKGNFSVPLIFALNRRVILCVPWNSWFCSEATARRFQSRPGYRRRQRRIAWVRAGTLCCHSQRNRKSTAPASPYYVLSVMPWRFLKLSSQPSLAIKSGMCINSASFKAFSLIRLPPISRLCSLACFSVMSTPLPSFECWPGFSFLRFDGIPALMAASITSFLLRISLHFGSFNFDAQILAHLLYQFVLIWLLLCSINDLLLLLHRKVSSLALLRWHCGQNLKQSLSFENTVGYSINFW